MIFKRQHDEEVLKTNKKFEGFSFCSKKYVYLQELENTFIDTGDSEEGKRWIFHEYQRFPEGIHGEVISFVNGGGDYDYEIVGTKRKFFLIGHAIDDMLIDIAGNGWRRLNIETDLYKTFDEELKLLRRGYGNEK